MAFAEYRERNKKFNNNNNNNKNNIGEGVERERERRGGGAQKARRIHVTEHVSRIRDNIKIRYVYV